MRTLDRLYDYACKEIRDGFACVSCKTFVTCIDGRAYTKECGAGHTCSLRDPFNGAVCYPNSPPDCLCSDKAELLPDPYNKQAYLECLSGATDPVVRHCQKDMVFVEELGMCQYSRNYGHCKRQGIFPNPEDCTEYYKCVPTAGGLIHYTFQCTCGFLFNELTGRCEDPCSFQPDEFRCEKEGRFPNQYDCSSYYTCITDATSETGFSQHLERCPRGSIWGVGSVTGTGDCRSAIKSACTNRGRPRCAVPKGRDCSAAPAVTTGRHSQPLNPVRAKHSYYSNLLFPEILIFWVILLDILDMQVTNQIHRTLLSRNTRNRWHYIVSSSSTPNATVFWVERDFRNGTVMEVALAPSLYFHPLPKNTSCCVSCSPFLYLQFFPAYVSSMIINSYNSKNFCFRFLRLNAWPLVFSDDQRQGLQYRFTIFALS